MQKWDPEQYAQHARFVSDLGGPVVDLLNPQPGERVLDLGCGDGALTERLLAAGCEVVAVDSSPEQVWAALERGLDARIGDASNLNIDGHFDAVFSNAALHWIKDPQPVIANVWNVLRPGGRFVAELGGAGCVAKVREALTSALSERDVDATSLDPWYFPTAEEYGDHLESQGFRLFRPVAGTARAGRPSAPRRSGDRSPADNVFASLTPRQGVSEAGWLIFAQPYLDGCRATPPRSLKAHGPPGCSRTLMGRSWKHESDPPEDPGNPTVNFHGERRRNDTHQSTTDPEAMCIGRAKARKPSWRISATCCWTIDRGLSPTCATHATGTAERDAAVLVAQRLPGQHGRGGQGLRCGALRCRLRSQDVAATQPRGSVGRGLCASPGGRHRPPRQACPRAQP